MKSCLFQSASVVAAVMIAGQGTAQAQTAQSGEAPAQIQEVVVTGSRIARQDYVAQSPILTTDQSVIENAGTATVDAYLNQLPQFQPGTGGFTNSTGGGDIGQATLNLRGLGTQRNLVLIDGRRGQAANAQGAIDLNTIPAAAIASVEVITGGASATYGSDAMAGVINFKLRNRFEGLEANVDLGRTSWDDGSSQQYSFIAGNKFLDGRLSAVFSAEYNKRGLITYNARPWSVGGQQTTSLPQGYFVPDGSNLPTQAAVNNVFAGYGVPAGTVARTSNFGFNQNGTLFKNGTPDANYQGSTAQPMILSSAGGIFFNGGYYNYVQIPLERYNVFSHLEYDLNDNIRLYGQVIYSPSYARSQGSPPSLIAPWQLDIPVSNPFIPANLQTILASRANPNATFLYNGRFWAAGPRSFENNSDTYQVLGGAVGSFMGMDYDVYAAHGDTRESVKGISGIVSMAAIRSLINAPDGGKSICAGGYNPFGLQPVSSACLNYVTRSPVSITDVVQDRVEGVLSGPVMKLPAGDMKFSLNADYQRNTYTFNPDAAFANNDISSITATNSTTGKLGVKEFSGEVLIPLLANLPLVQSLNINPGYRYSDYDVFGGASTYKADFDWRVAEPLMLRGGYQRAVRAPNIGELFLAGTQTISVIGLPPSGGDPCDTRSPFRAGANAAAVRNLCIATGLNPGIVDSFTQFTGSIVSQTAGNASLKPETANTFTIGGVFRPTFAPAAINNMSLSVDYYDIRIEGAIASIAASTSLSKCFNGDGSNPTYSPNNYYCTLFQRDPVSGQFIAAFQPYLNLGGYKTSGVDTEWDWRLALSDLGLTTPSAVKMSVIANYLNTFKIQNLQNSPFQDFAGTISSSNSYPRWKAVTSLSYEFPTVGEIGLRWRFIGAMADSSSVTSPATAAPGVSSYNYYDLVGRLSLGKNWELRASITNLTDKQPPVVSGTPANTNTGVYDIQGRFYSVGMKLTY